MSAEFNEKDRFSAWLVQLQHRLLSALRTSGRPRADHGDIASIAVADAMAKGPSIMDRYPNPAVYASVRVRHAAESYYRSDRAQRGEGSRLYGKADGTLEPGRRVVSADAAATSEVGDERSYYERSITVPGFEDDAVDAIVGGDLLRSILTACAGAISQQDLDLFVLNKAYGHSVSELAAFHHVTRETMSRRLSRVTKVILANRAWFEPPV